MSLESQHIMPVLSQDGEVYAVLLSRALWDIVEPLVRDQGKALLQEPASEIKEPLQDWEMLKAYWDFQYPYNAQVHCDQCGAATEDWEQDEPRKFRLKTASLGGLAGFECLHCGARILKRHFKDKCVFECRQSKGC